MQLLCKESKRLVCPGCPCYTVHMVLSDFPILDCAWRFIAVTIVAFATHCVNLAKGKAEFESRMFQTVYVVTIYLNCVPWSQVYAG